MKKSVYEVQCSGMKLLMKANPIAGYFAFAVKTEMQSWEQVADDESWHFAAIMGYLLKIELSRAWAANDFVTSSFIYTFKEK